MKQATFNTFFKAVKESSNIAKVAPSLVGKKRDDLTVTYNAITTEDVPTLQGEHVALILNKAIESYGKQLIAEKETDWDYCPTQDDLTLEKVYEEYVRPSNKGNRILSKDALKAFANDYGIITQKYSDKEVKRIETFQKIIMNKFAVIAGNDQMVDKCIALLNDYLSLIENDDVSDDDKEIILSYEKELSAMITLLEGMSSINLLI